MRNHTGAVLLVLLAAMSMPAAAQEVALKGGLALSKFETDRPFYFDDGLTATSLGLHGRFGLGPVAFQPEFHVVTRGGVSSAAAEHESTRLEYMEIPLLLAVPLGVDRFEFAPFAGPFIALETRCRYVFEEQGLKTTVGCSSNQPFSRRAFDYGLTAGAGLSYDIGTGSILVEGRYTRGFRDVHEGPADVEIHNRTVGLMIGYVVVWSPEPGR